MTDEQIERDYEEETGVQITDCFKDRSPNEVPMVIVAGHAPFTWGKNGADAVYHAVILEEIARMAYLTKTLQPNTAALKQGIVDKHYLRKHGKKCLLRAEVEILIGKIARIAYFFVRHAVNTSM